MLTYAGGGGAVCLEFLKPGSHLSVSNVTSANVRLVTTLGSGCHWSTSQIVCKPGGLDYQNYSIYWTRQPL